MKLYYSPAYCSLAVHIALREAGLAFELHKVDTVAGRVDDGRDWRAIQPRGYVPMLELDDGSRHTETAALLQYVGSLDPSGALMPADARQRLEVNQWLTFVSTELHKVFSPWLWHADTADSTVKAARDKIALRFADMERHLASHEWLALDRFTVADAYAFAIVSWAKPLRIDLKPYPRLAAWQTRVAARPHVKAALVAEGLAA